MAERKIHLSSAQQLEFTSVSESITDDELEFYYTLTAEDIQIINTHRGQDNRLGFAMTLCCLRHKGWPYPVLDSVPLKVLSFVSAQIDVDPEVIQEYGRNKNTKSNHLLEICSYYGYRQEDAWSEVTDFIRCSSHRLNDLVAITKETVQFSKERRIIPPKLSTIARMAHDAIGEEEERVFASVAGSLSSEQKEKLDQLLELTDGNTSSLFEMKDVSGRWNSSSFNELAE